MFLRTELELYRVLCERCNKIDQQIELEKNKKPYVKLVAILEIEGILAPENPILMFGGAYGDAYIPNWPH